ncbi:non-ribosomal peptide synthetase [Legionella sp.]|uniref:non-ribosomal peptide synthetase n=1 Tax=Legionella sp. TaxID=459 RepID=UPI000CC25ACF|nr:non-ribosomal peptide synthetase [Legionella sp.]PJE18214.1 MAG: hypothetical protein CK430_00595 [Legionella sp.]
MNQNPFISIIGMACEFAGQADSLTHFYQVILDAADATTDIAPNRWQVDMQQVPDLIKHGGYLKRNPWTFDAQSFAISPKEAARMDPQHRILLEHTYHAFEDAQIDPKQVKGTRCGVFIGLGTQDYSRVMHTSGDFGGFHSKGSLGSMAAGRIAYHFDLIGPNFVVDTACSSSLVALHQAVQSLKNNECDIAVVGGTTLILTIDYNLDLTSAGLMAKDGRCKPFSQNADGFARGEGVGVIILQKHADALKDKRRIYANILGSAINSDGKTNGIIAPSKEAQKRVIKEALANAKVHPDQVNFIETHGTGTNLGDKIEFAALCDVYQDRKTPLYIGSVKGNIAHCEAAAGLASVIKTSLCIYHGIIPPHTAAHCVNPDLRHDLLQVEFPKQIIEKSTIIGGVSSFGMSGSNAHVVLGSEGQELAEWGVYKKVFARTELMPEYLKQFTPNASRQNTLELVPTCLELQINVDLTKAKDAYIAQHVINNQQILPGSYYVDTSIALMQKLSRDYLGNQQPLLIEIQRMLILRPVIFEDSSSEHLRVVISQKKANNYHVTYYRTAEPQVIVCELQVFIKASEQSKQSLPEHSAVEKKSVVGFYQRYADCGVTYGSLFKRLASYYPLDVHNIIAEIFPPDSEQCTISHAVFIDNCLQTIGLGLVNVGHAYVPTNIASLTLFQDESWNTVFQCHAQITTLAEEYLEANLTVYNSKNEVVMRAQGVVCQAVDVEQFKKQNIHYVDWQPVLPNPSALDYYEPCTVVFNDKKTQVAEFLACFSTPNESMKSLSFADFIAGAELTGTHLIYLADFETDSLFQSFNQLYSALCLHDEKHPGRLKKLTLVSCEHFLVLMRAVVLAFPTEFPNIDFRYLYYDTFNSDNVHYLFGEIATDSDKLVAPFWQVKSNELYRYQISPLLSLNTSPKVLKTDGYYLLIGGLGGIGKNLLKHMLANLGIKKVIVTYSKPESLAENLSFIEQLTTGYEANILCKQLDVTNSLQFELLCKTLPRPLYGIYHLAGINIDQSLGRITAESIATTRAVKVDSAWKLHEFSLQIPELEQFVLFSSLATLVPSPGQFSYALANLGLVDLADYRSSLNLPVTIIDWGPWANTGMMAKLSANAKSSVAVRDFKALEPELCCASLFACLNVAKQYHFAVFKLDRSQIAKVAVEDNPSITECNNEDYVQQLLVQLIAEETDHEICSINDGSDLTDLGLDSINTIRIRSELQTQLNISIPLSLLLTERTVGSLKQKLNRLWLDSQANEVSPVVEYTSKTEDLISETRFYPLSANQFSIWFEQQTAEHTTAYNCSIGWKITGKSIHLEQFQHTWRIMLQRHELLRALFTHQNNELGYKIIPMEEALTYPMLIIEELSADAVVDDYLQTHLNRFIDLANELATKVYLIEQGNEVYLMLSSHHIVMDAAAMFQLGDQLVRSLCVPGFVLPTVTEPASYHEFTDFQRQHTIPDALSFLLQQVLDDDNELRAFELPKNDSQQSIDLTRGGSIKLELDADELQTIMSLPASMRVHLCLSAWALLLAKYTDERNVLIGIAFNGRTQKKWTDIIGHFVNVLPLCIPVDQNKACLDFVTSVKNHLIELMEFQDLPLMKLMMQDRVKKVLQGRKLLQTYFNYFDASELEMDINNQELHIEPLMYPQQEAQFEVSLWVTQTIDSYSFDIKYQRDLFSDTILTNLVQHYKLILLQLGRALLNKESSQRLRDIKLVTGMDETGLLPVFVAEQPDKLVYDHFMDYVSLTPEAIAIEMQSQTISYKQLSSYVDQLAATLAEFPQHRDETVGILSPERANIEFIVTVLALWKQGYAFAPLNKHYPLERIKYTMETIACKKIININQECSAEILNYVNSMSHMLVLDLSLHNESLEIQLVNQPTAVLTSEYSLATTASDLAYVLFTSGSTGLPKGVLVEQGGLIDRLLWMKKYFNYSAQNKFLQSTMVTFDVSLPEYCLPLICGGTTVLFHQDDNPHAHAELCARHSVTMVSTVPSLFSILQDNLAKCTSLQHIIMIGEVLPPANVNQWLQSGTACKLYNLYGPTEVTVYATAYECSNSVLFSQVPIGTPCDNVIALVLDSYGNLVPEGVVGELYLSGTGVARGYIGGQLKTNPFADNPYQSRYPRIYKTGDFVRWRDQNALEYLGRKDNRVKLHGLLIELGEIEQLVLKVCPDVKNACALIVPSQSGGSLVKHIVLCVMPVVDDIDVLFSDLQQHLPKYMLPWKIVTLADFPRNTSGKIDRKELIEVVQSFCEQESDEHIVPIKPIVALSFVEQECIKIWEHLLRKKNINLEDNFFQLGGDSLLLAQMTLLVEQQLTVKINFAKFLANPTIDSLLNGVIKQLPSWDKEFDLNELIAPYGEPKNSNGIFLTGATGHLGIHLLKALLDQTDKQIHVLIRAATVEKARIRLINRFSDVFSSVLDCSHVHLYSGDLAQPDLGLDASAFSTLCDSISIIIHAAAEVNHVVDYARLKTNNVLVSNNMLQVANLSKSEHLFYISTQFSEINNLTEWYLDNSLITQFVSGYEQSKFMAESLMHKATELGYPVTTLRLPLILDSQDPLLLRQNHFVAFIMKCMRMGYYPDLHHTFDVLPTEQVATFIAQSCDVIPDQSSVYNCLNHSISLTDLFDYLNEHSNTVTEKRDYEFWRTLLISTTNSEDPFYKLLPLYTSMFSSQEISNSRTIENKLYLSKNNQSVGDDGYAKHTKYLAKLLHSYFSILEH